MGLQIKTASEIAAANYNIGKILASPNGLEKIALETLPTYIKEHRDYQAFGREVLHVHEVTVEELQLIDNEPFVYYPKDLNSHAAFFGRDGQPARYQVEGTGVNVGIIQLVSDEMQITVKELIIQRYNYLERTKDLAGQAIAKLEDGRILDLLECLLMGKSTDKKNPDHKGQIVCSPETILSKNLLVAVKKKLSQHDLPLGAFVMNTSRMDDILTWATTEIDQLTQREILESGVKYSIWGGVKLVPSIIVPMNTIYGFSSTDYVGRMPILRDLTVELTQVKNKLAKGLFMYELIGFYLASHKAVAKLLLEWKEGDALINEPIIKDVAKGIDARDTKDPVKGYGSREEM